MEEHVPYPSFYEFYSKLIYFINNIIISLWQLNAFICLDFKQIMYYNECNIKIQI
jgi:hypothetical protein